MNSTYAMLECALENKSVFSRYKEMDYNYKWLPSDEDWKRVAEVSKFLEVFNDVTKVLSGRKYPTSNLFLRQIWKVRKMLNDMSTDNRDFVKRMTLKMKEKFDKYWGECNLVMAILAVLDPRYKMKLILYSFPKIYPTDDFQGHIDDVRESLQIIYKEYLSVDSQINSSMSSATYDSNPSQAKKQKTDDFDEWVITNSDIIPGNKSEIDMYLDEGVYKPGNEEYEDFDALNWWKANSLKFRNLSKMA